LGIQARKLCVHARMKFQQHVVDTFVIPSRGRCLNPL
jgi:hypothetical protein